MTGHRKSEKYRLLESIGMGPYVMKKLRVCQKCGHLAKRWSFFCPACRRSLTLKTLFEQYRGMHTCCAVCGTLLADDTRYCPHCGKSQTKK